MFFAQLLCQAGFYVLLGDGVLQLCTHTTGYGNQWYSWRGGHGVTSFLAICDQPFLAHVLRQAEFYRNTGQYDKAEPLYREVRAVMQNFSAPKQTWQ